MLNDVEFFGCKVAMDATVVDSKNTFSENTPYQLMASPISRDERIVIFSQHFIDTFRMVISDTTSACILQMGKSEREVYYAFVDHQNGITIPNAELNKVVVALNTCLVNELTCKTEDYLNLCFSEAHTWNTCVVPDEGRVIVITQDGYDDLVNSDRVVDGVVYSVTTDEVVTKIYLNHISIWTA